MLLTAVDPVGLRAAPEPPCQLTGAGHRCGWPWQPGLSMWRKHRPGSTKKALA